MKILMPLSAIETNNSTENSGINSKIITGGIERFSQSLYNSVPGIIPISISKDDRKHKRTKRIVSDAVAKHNPDMILSNWPWHYNMLRKFELPISTVYHEPLVRDMRFIEMGSIFKQMKEDGAHLYFVSKGQFEFHKALVKRIKDYDITENDVAGFINSSYCENMQFSEEYEWDCTTVGRCDGEKNPFIIHKKLSSTDKISLVMTNDVTYKSDRMNQYVADNQHWNYPQCTKRSVPHEEVLKNISKSKVFVSTWPKESWGITAMEALGSGVPLILLTDSSGVHCSESIADDKSHFIKLDRKSSTVKEFNEAVESLSSYSLEKRKEIYDKTNKKHSKKKWVKQFTTMIDKRMEDAPHKSTLTEFMQ
jgi:hypothetical protein